MATEQGILQALWGEVRPAVEARSLDLVRPCIALLNRRKTEAALAKFAEILAQPPAREQAVLTDLAKRVFGKASGVPATRSELWSALTSRAPERWATCRLFLDEPLPERIWLERRGHWILYRWSGTRFVGLPLDIVLQEASAGSISPEEAMLTLRVSGLAHRNPKLPPGGVPPQV